MPVLRALAALTLLFFIGSMSAAVAGGPPRAEKAVARPSSAKVRLAANKPAGGAQSSWPQFLGPERDNRSPETGLLAEWPQGGPKLVATIRGLGIAYSNVSVADGVFYTFGNRDEREYVAAFRYDTGERVWEFDNGKAFHNGYDGPRGTPTIDGDRLFALGANGDLACLERKTGAKVWQKNILKEFGSGVPGWGICESVLIDGDRLICTPGARDATLVALDKRTGNVVWKAQVPENDHTGYASPIAIEVGGVRQYVQFTGRGTIGVRAADGKFLWRDDSAANGTANCCSPVAADGMVFSASGYGKGGSMVQLTSNGSETRCTFAWHSNEMKVHHGGMVVVDGCVYGSNDPGILTCIELKTGNIKWTNRSVGKGSVTWAEGKLILRSEAGPVAMVAATPDAYKELGRFDQPERSHTAAWPYPVVADGRLFLRDQDLMLVYDIKAH